MRFRRALEVVVGLALLLPMLALGGPAAPATAAPAAPGRAYVTDAFAATVTVIDTNSHEIVTVIPVGAFPQEATVSPDGSVVYVASGEEASVYVIDTATNTVATTIAVGELPQGIVFTPDGARAYVVNGQSQTVSVIDTATNTVIATIPLADRSYPFEVAMSPDGTRAYVTNSGLNTVSVINTSTNTVIATIPVAEIPWGVVVSPDGARAYVTNSGSNTVSVIITATNTVIATIPVDPNPRGIDVGPEGSEVYVASNDQFTISVIATASNTVTAKLPSGIGSPMSVEVTSRRVYLTGLSGHYVVMDRAAQAVVATVVITDPNNDFSGFAWGLAVIESSALPPPATPTITTQASPGNVFGTVVTDTATVTGGANPTGEVIFRLYIDPACLQEAFSSTNPLVGGTATSDNYTPNAGTYYWRAVYTGDANNNPAANPCQAPHETVVISPFVPPAFTQTITGDYVGPLIVNAGDSVQLLNARVAGPVTVNPGGKLTVINSQVTRGIVANRPGFLMICGSQISGPSPGQALGVFDSDVPVRIGDTSFNCAGNRFAGSVNLIGNMTLTVGSNVVSGNLTVNDNGPGATFIKSNNILGTLACSGNNPPPTPTRPLNRNTAGARSGQCTGVF